MVYAQDSGSETSELEQYRVSAEARSRGTPCICLRASSRDGLIVDGYRRPFRLSCGTFHADYYSDRIRVSPSGLFLGNVNID